MTCDWPLLGCDSCCDLDVPPDIETAAQTAAINWLWEATNRRFGNCPVEILPCMKRCGSGYSGQWVPYRTASGWYNIGCGTCGDSCSCTSISEFLLPTIGTVIDITLDGVPMATTDYRVDNMRRVVRLDGGVWPPCQDLNDPTWTLTYTPGLEVPEMGQMAAASLACQIARKMCGQKCDLPSNTTQVTRQGVTITLDPGKMTGLWLVDQWIELANRPMSRVWSPDLSVTRVVESLS